MINKGNVKLEREISFKLFHNSTLHTLTKFEGSILDMGLSEVIQSEHLTNKIYRRFEFHFELKFSSGGTTFKV